MGVKVVALHHEFLIQRSYISMNETELLKLKIQNITGSLIFNSHFDSIEVGEMRKALLFINEQILNLFIQELKKKPDDNIDHSIDVRYEPDVIKAFDKFIEKWCGSNAAHLLDSDEQDGQFMREKIQEAFMSHA